MNIFNRKKKEIKARQEIIERIKKRIESISDLIMIQCHAKTDLLYIYLYYDLALIKRYIEHIEKHSFEVNNTSIYPMLFFHDNEGLMLVDYWKDYFKSKHENACEHIVLHKETNNKKEMLLALTTTEVAIIGIETFNLI